MILCVAWPARTDELERVGVFAAHQVQVSLIYQRFADIDMRATELGGIAQGVVEGWLSHESASRQAATLSAELHQAHDAAAVEAANLPAMPSLGDMRLVEMDEIALSALTAVEHQSSEAITSNEAIVAAALAGDPQIFVQLATNQVRQELGFIQIRAAHIRLQQIFVTKFESISYLLDAILTNYEMAEVLLKQTLEILSGARLTFDTTPIKKKLLNGRNQIGSGREAVPPQRQAMIDAASKGTIEQDNLGLILAAIDSLPESYDIEEKILDRVEVLILELEDIDAAAAVYVFEIFHDEITDLEKKRTRLWIARQRMMQDLQ